MLTPPHFFQRPSPRLKRRDGCRDIAKDELDSLTHVMTLIISCATRTHVIQVSDRRLTRLSDGGLLTDGRNKAVLFDHRVAISYTGLAEVSSRTPTDRWIAQCLVDERCETIDRAMQVLAARATDAFASIRLRAQQKRHAFVGVGWARREGGMVAPLYFHVSNSMTREGRWLREAAEEFKVFTHIGTGHKSFLLFTCGANVPREDIRALEARIGQSIAEKTDSAALVRHMVDTLYSIADRNVTVGRNVMTIVLPRAAVQGPNEMVLSSAPRVDTATFEYMSESNPTAVQFGPHAVGGDFGLLDFKFTPLTPDNLADGTTEVTVILPRDLEDPLEAEIRRLMAAVRAANAEPHRIITLCRRILQKLEGRTFKRPVFIEALVKAQFTMAMAYIDLGETGRAIPLWESALVSLALCNGAEPRQFTALILNNLAVYHLNEQRYEQAIMYCDRCLEQLAKTNQAGKIVWRFRDFIDNLGTEMGISLARQYSKAFRNKALSLVALGREAEAQVIAEQHNDAFRLSGDREMERRVQELRAVCLTPAKCKEQSGDGT